MRWGFLNARGAVPEDRAALLASKGFVTLALAFFGVDPLPKVDLFFFSLQSKICQNMEFSALLRARYRIL